MVDPVSRNLIFNNLILFIGRVKKLVFSDDSSDENQTVKELQNRFEQNRKGEGGFYRLFQKWF